jgi:hypothetical protein
MASPISLTSVSIPWRHGAAATMSPPCVAEKSERLLVRRGRARVQEARQPSSYVRKTIGERWMRRRSADSAACRRAPGQRVGELLGVRRAGYASGEQRRIRNGGEAGGSASGKGWCGAVMQRECTLIPLRILIRKLN